MRADPHEEAARQRAWQARITAMEATMEAHEVATEEQSTTQRYREASEKAKRLEVAANRAMADYRMVLERSAAARRIASLSDSGSEP